MKKVGHIIKEIGNFASLILALLGFLGITIIDILGAIKFDFSTLEIVLLSILALVCLGLSIHFIRHRCSIYSYYYPPTKIVPKAEISNLSYHYHCNTENILTLKVTCKVKSLRSDLDGWKVSLGWTGLDDSGKSKNITKNDITSVNGDNIDNWSIENHPITCKPILKINFKRSLNKNDSTEFTYILKLENCNSSKPYLSQDSSEHPIRGIAYNIEIDDKYINSNTIKFIESTTNGIYTLKEDIVKCENGVAKKEIKKCHRFRRYEMIWEWRSK